jgi:hypothetical protein
MFVKISKVCIGLAFGAAMAALGADAIGEGVSGSSRTAPASTTDAAAKAA